MRISWLSAVLSLETLLSLTGPAFGQSVGSEFQVNTFTTGHQYLAPVAFGPDGTFHVVWASDGQDGDGRGIFAQRYDPGGSAQGAEFQVNTTVAGNQQAPSAATDVSGRMVVVWHTEGGAVRGQRYDPAGSAQGSELFIDDAVVNHRPAVALGAGGTFMALFEVQGTGHVYGRTYDASGVPLAPRFRVSTSPSNTKNSSITAAPDGGFVVVWEVQDGSGLGVFGRRFDAAGAAQGVEFSVNTYTTGDQRSVGVASDPSGDFVVVWDSDGQDESLTGVFAQKFDAVGTPLGTEFRVNGYTTGAQAYPAVTTDAAGSFLVVWQSDTPDGGVDIFGRTLAANGSLGPEFRANTYTTGVQGYPHVASDPRGGFVVTWMSAGQDGDGYGVFGQRFASPDLIFRNGFDSGG
jgi:hypothetical protein